MGVKKHTHAPKEVYNKKISLKGGGSLEETLVEAPAKPT